MVQSSRCRLAAQPTSGVSSFMDSTCANATADSKSVLANTTANGASTLFMESLLGLENPQFPDWGIGLVWTGKRSMGPLPFTVGRQQSITEQGLSRPSLRLFGFS